MKQKYYFLIGLFLVGGYLVWTGPWWLSDLRAVKYTKAMHEVKVIEQPVEGGGEEEGSEDVDLPVRERRGTRGLDRKRAIETLGRVGIVRPSVEIARLPVEIVRPNVGGDRPVFTAVSFDLKYTLLKKQQVEAFRLKDQLGEKKFEEVIERIDAGDSAGAEEVMGPAVSDDAILKYVIGGVGVLFLVLMLVVSIKIPKPTEHQRNTFRTVLAIGVAFMAQVLSGFLDVESEVAGWGIKAGGPMGVFVLVYFFKPGMGGGEVEGEEGVGDLV